MTNPQPAELQKDPTPMYTPDAFTTPRDILTARAFQEETGLKALFRVIEEALEAWILEAEKEECAVQVGYPPRQLAEHARNFYRDKGWIVSQDTATQSWVFKLPVTLAIEPHVVTITVKDGVVPELDLGVELFDKPIPSGPADLRFIVVERKLVPEGVPMELWTSKETSELHAVNRNRAGEIAPDRPENFDHEYAWAIIANPAWVAPKPRPMTTCRQTIPAEEEDF